MSETYFRRKDFPNDEGDCRFHIRSEHLAELVHNALVLGRIITDGTGKVTPFDLDPDEMRMRLFQTLAAMVDDAGGKSPNYELVVDNPPLRECGCRGYQACYRGAVHGFTLDANLGRHVRTVSVEG
jgi:hypothetical protein